MKRIVLIFVLITIILIENNAQEKNSDANIIGHVVCHGQHLSFVNIAVKGTALGTVSDETGHFRIYNLPPGKHTIIASCVGYKMVESEIQVYNNATMELNFELEEDVLGMEEVVISSDRNAKKRGNTPVVVNTLSHDKLNMTQSVSLSDGINFMTGLRMESNCQNCGFSQVRLNGMEGPYSQILVNSKPIFSGLAGVYGLELIPANIIERIEVVRGGGSALYGGNAIAGTINLILRDPIKNYFEAGVNSGMSGLGMKNSGNPAWDKSVNFNTSVVTDDLKTGLSLYGFYRERSAFDANDDGYSELVELDNTSFGSRFYHRFGYRSRLTADFLNIRESRRGGSDLDKPEHEAMIAESVKHNITNASLNFEQFFKEEDKLSIFASGQSISRDSYYGAGQSLSDYGLTKGLTYNAGIQYNGKMNTGSYLIGVEHTGDKLVDTKLGYPDVNAAFLQDNTPSFPHIDNTVIVNQLLISAGFFSQADLELGKANISAGARLENYKIFDLTDKQNNDKGSLSGLVLSPRLSLLYKFTPLIKARLSYAQGYRAPQVFDEDLHIESSGSRKVIHVNSVDLKQETSQSLTASIDLNASYYKMYISLLVETFYTRLQDAFTNEFGEPDSLGTITYTRKNAQGGATVKGINIESDFIPNKKINIKIGYTIQDSRYDEEQEFGEKRFFRTPSSYGYFTSDLKISNDMGLVITGTYTGKMLVPHFGPDPQTTDPQVLAAINSGDVIAGERLETSASFFDMGLKLRYNIKLNGATLQLSGGIKNIFNAFQPEFDQGFYRDPGYVYGPTQPRMIYIGIKVGNRILN